MTVRELGLPTFSLIIKWLCIFIILTCTKKRVLIFKLNFVHNLKIHIGTIPGYGLTTLCLRGGVSNQFTTFFSILCTVFIFLSHSQKIITTIILFNFNPTVCIVGDVCGGPRFYSRRTNLGNRLPLFESCGLSTTWYARRSEIEALVIVIATAPIARK